MRASHQHYASGRLLIVLASGAMALGAMSARAQSLSDLPYDQPTTVGGVEAVCTGVGEDARADPRWNAYSLKIELAGKGGQFLGDTQVTVSKNDKPVVDVKCGGPWVLFKLPAARYAVSATTEGKTVSSTANVPATGQGRIILRFPELGGAISAPGEGNPAEKASDNH